MKRFTLFLSFLFVAHIVNAQTFQKTFGGTNDDRGRSVQQTLDSGYIITGYTKSFNNSFQDVYLIKTDAYCDTLWTKIYGGIDNDYGYAVQQTNDSGYIVTGGTNSFGAGLTDIYLIKTDSNGDVLWTKTYGGTGTDGGNSVQQTTDGGYIIGANTHSFGATGNWDIYLIKTDVNGDTLWTKTYGGPLSDYISLVEQTIDGGFIICGYTDSFGAGSNDIYLIKIDSSGNTEWSRTYGSTFYDIGWSVQQTNDTGFVITGLFSIVNNLDTYLIKTDSYGDTLWTKTYAGPGNHVGSSVQQTTDGGYIIAGSYAPGAGTTSKVFLLKTDAAGDTSWTNAFGQGLNNQGMSVHQTFEGGYIVTGYTNNFGAGDYDISIIKTDSMGHGGCYEAVSPLIVTTPELTVTTPATIITFPATVVTSPATQVGSGGIVTTLCASVGINALATDNPFFIFPNPSSDYLTITFGTIITKGYIKVLNTLGENVYEQKIFNESKKEINLGNISDGIYFVKVFNGEKSYSQKLIVEHIR